MFSSGSLSFRSYIKVFALFLIEFCARWNLISLFYMLISISLSTTSWKGYHFSNACFPLSKIRWLSWLSLRILYLPRHNFYPLLLFPFLHRLSNLQWWIRTNVKTDDLRTVSVSRWDALAGKQACQQASQPEFDCCVESGVHSGRGESGRTNLQSHGTSTHVLWYKQLITTHTPHKQ